MLPNHTQAPDFTLQNQDGETVQLSHFKGQKNIVLAFYPFDWSAVCSDQMALYSQMRMLFEAKNTVLLGISVDSVYCHKAFSENRNLHIDLLSDFEPKGAVAKLYESYNDKGFCNRNLYVIDTNGTVRWSYVSPTDVNPGADGILDALDALLIDKP